MADVFISYAQENRDQARAVAAIVERYGYSVWWDRKLTPGNVYTDLIEEKLGAAKAVVVLWSESSRKSLWVRDEAAVGRDRNLLVPVSIDGTTPPLGFRQLQTVAFEALHHDGEVERSFATTLLRHCGDDSSPPSFSAITASSQKPIARIVDEEIRQRRFVSAFWLMSCGLSAVITVILSALNERAGESKMEDASTGIFAILVFLWATTCLSFGRFLIIVGRRLSKRKSVRYFDIPTSIVFAGSAFIGFASFGANDFQTYEGALITTTLVSLTTFVIFAATSVPVGFALGIRRTVFKEGR